VNTAHAKVKTVTQQGWSEERSSKIPKMTEEKLTVNRHQSQQQRDGGGWFQGKRLYNGLEVIYNGTD